MYRPSSPLRSLVIALALGAVLWAPVAAAFADSPGALSLSVSPSNRTIDPGAAAVYAVRLAADASLTVGATLQVNGLPAGATGSFDHDTVLPGGTASLMVHTALTTPAGLQRFTVGAQVGSLRSTTTATLTVRSKLYLPFLARRWPPLPYAPALNPITNGGLGNYTVSWSEAPSQLSTTYTLEEATDRAFTHGVRTACTAAGRLCALTGRLGGTYHYRVRGQNRWGVGPWSNVQAVTVVVRRVPDDPSYSAQWALRTVNAERAWGSSTGAGVVIAVVDTGVDRSHPELAGKLLPGWDLVNDDADPQDDAGHGTHVAGIAAAVTDNGVGVAGMGWDARVLPVKVLDSGGSGYISAIAQGVRWAVDRGAQVINLSLGSEYSSSTLQAATDYARDHGRLVVAAAGNCGGDNYAANGCSQRNPTFYPAANPGVLAVAATRSYGDRASFSDVGSFVDVAAPGQEILSTWRGGGYATLSGTSMAAPLVSGLAALVWAAAPRLSPAQAEGAITSSAVDLGAAGQDDEYGAGRIDAPAAVAAAGAAQAGTLPRAVTGPEPLSAGAVEVGAGLSTSPAGRPASGVSQVTPLPAVRPGIVLVRLRPGAAAADGLSVARRHGAQLRSRLSGLDVLVLGVPAGQEAAEAARLAADPQVEFAEPDYLMTAQ